jgi:hypothetical protein
MSDLERDFYGFAGAGPLTVSLVDGSVHVALGDAGVWLDPYRARQLARFIEQAAGEAERCRRRGAMPEGAADALLELADRQHEGAAFAQALEEA